MSDHLTLTRDEIQGFLHHLHIIPVSKGLTGRWMHEHASGWGTGDLVRALRAAGAVVRSDHFSGFALAPGVSSAVVREGMGRERLPDDRLCAACDEYRNLYTASNGEWYCVTHFPEPAEGRRGRRRLSEYARSNASIGVFRVFVVPVSTAGIPGFGPTDGAST